MRAGDGSRSDRPVARSFECVSALSMEDGGWPFSTRSSRTTTARPDRAATRAPRTGWPWFMGWALVGMALAIQVSVIGLFFLPILLLGPLVLARLTGAAEALGVVGGGGSVIALIGLLNLDYQPCPNGTVVLPPGQTSYECGGFDGTPSGIVGVLLMA